MRSFEELFDVADKLEQASLTLDASKIAAPLEQLENAAKQVQRSFSGSWLGYHSRVYYENFVSTPAGANFSQEWGLQDLSFTSLGSVGDWQEYQFEFVKLHIQTIAGSPNIIPAKEAAKAADQAFGNLAPEVISILETETANQADPFLAKLTLEIEHLTPMSKIDVASQWSPKGQIMTRDMIAMGQKTQIPPHIDVLAEIASLRHSIGICSSAAAVARKAASHLERKSRKQIASKRIGTNVFIGHGRSGAWRELKDFVQDRLGLPWDEFNRVPIAGVTNIARLSQMLDDAAIALLVMTAEDAMADGAVQARMNVIHEAGLFQGRLGFSKAIIVLEHGCEEFSNIQGLGQIRFPKNKISAAFEEVRQLMEREGLLES